MNKTINKIYKDLLLINSSAASLHKHGADSVDVLYHREYSYKTIEGLSSILEDKEIKYDKANAIFESVLNTTTALENIVNSEKQRRFKATKRYVK